MNLGPTDVVAYVGADTIQAVPKWRSFRLVSQTIALMGIALLFLAGPANAGLFDPQIRSAAARGDLAKVVQLLDAGARVDETNPGGNTALMAAAEEGHVEIMEELVKRGANLDAAAQHGDTALSFACWKGKVKAVEFLIEHGANVNTRGSGGRSPIIVGADFGNYEIVRILLDHGADPSVRSDAGRDVLAEILGNDKQDVALIAQIRSKLSQEPTAGRDGAVSGIVAAGRDGAVSGIVAAEPSVFDEGDLRIDVTKCGDPYGFEPVITAFVLVPRMYNLADDEVVATLAGTVRPALMAKCPAATKSPKNGLVKFSLSYDDMRKGRYPGAILANWCEFRPEGDTKCDGKNFQQAARDKAWRDQQNADAQKYEDQAKARALAAEAAKQAKVGAFAQRYGATGGWVNWAEIGANPFAFDGKVLVFPTHLGGMVTANSGLFGTVLFTNLPQGVFITPDAGVVLAGRVSGTATVKNMFGLEVQVPQVTYLGHEFCKDRSCEEFLGSLPSH